VSPTESYAEVPYDALPPIARTALFEQLSADAESTWVLCSGSRLAQHLQDAYGRWQIARGCEAWPTPTMLAPETLLRESAARSLRGRWRSGERGPALLSDAESDLIWRLVVAETSGEQTLLRPSEAAQLAAQAWRLCQDFQLSLPLPAATADVERFNVWAEAYRSRCERIGRVDAGAARAQQIAALAADARLPPQLVLAGFDAPPPWQRQVWSALQARGSRLLRLAEPQPTATPRAAVAADAAQELRACAQWVRDTALRAPDARIGVVVPDLGARRADLQRVFDQTLCPSLDSLNPGRAQRPYNISLGEALPQQGLVQCALQLLRLCVEGVDLAAAGSLLCSPYWGQRGSAEAVDAVDSERLQRAELDRRLREDGHLRVDLNVLLRVLPAPAGSGPLAQRLRALQAARAQAGRADPADWSERFSAWLDLAGWPGPRALDSIDYQAVQAWRELLGALGALGGVLGAVPASGALHQLQVLAQGRVFQPQTPPVRIQVLGALEAQGQVFDALWVLGLDDERWPPGGRPNPFIPFALQRQHGMPHASTAHELAWAERMTTRWRAAASEVVFSWAAMDGERPLAPSPLIREEAAAAVVLTAEGLNPAWSDQRAVVRIETRADAYAPAPRPEAAVPGGARLLGDQARCPFRAFATHRLGARALEQPGHGLSPIDRGELVHRSLETIWRQLRTQAELLALSDDAQAQQVGVAVDAELEWLQRIAPQRLGDGLRRLEAERLRTLLHGWLQLERERPPFTVELIEGSAVDAPEAAQGDAQLVRFGELLLRLRPDRVDRLEDGAQLVIDYKTGARRPLPWHDGRPEEPQLLIYALTRADTRAVAYGRLVQGQLGLDGIADDAERVPGIMGYTQISETREASSWDGLMGRWRGELETVADEVRRGLASVTPKHTRQSCRDCTLHALCRIHEVQPGAAFDDDPEALA
jgi:ATP-dependent helicase/nuclease subunit B